MKIVFPHSSLIASTQAVEFKQGEIIKQGDPVIVPEHAWEGNLTYLYGSVVKTTIYRMWYQAHGIYVAYARSRDGIHWEKPLLGLVDHDGSKKNNFLPWESQIPAGGTNVLLDKHDPNPQRRYKSVYYSQLADGHAAGLYVSFSHDGIHWRDFSENPVLSTLVHKYGNQNRSRLPSHAASCIFSRSLIRSWRVNFHWKGLAVRS